LKQKRGRLKPLLARLRREFNLSTAEVGLQDSRTEAVIACSMVGSNGAFLQSALQGVLRWTEAHWPDGQVLDEQIEIL
jgi:hypothetical protein